MRRYLRHPSDMPVELIPLKQPVLTGQRLNNISLGGVACKCCRGFQRGSAVAMRFPLFGQQAQYPGVVAWCHKQLNDYLVGIAFTDEDTLFRARMVEQVCQIEHYRQQRMRELGEELPIESVALEWIADHAAEFAESGLQS